MRELRAVRLPTMGRALRSGLLRAAHHHPAFVGDKAGIRLSWYRFVVSCSYEESARRMTRILPAVTTGKSVGATLNFNLGKNSRDDPRAGCGGRSPHPVGYGRLISGELGISGRQGRAL